MNKIIILIILTLSVQKGFSTPYDMERFSAKAKLLVPGHENFHSVKHIPLEMAQFYLAMGISEYWHCAQDNDPLSCSEYLDMMSDPISHLGFTFFMMASRKVTNLGQKNKITAPIAGYLGLASGMLVQTVFEEIYRHPDMQDFLKTRYIDDPEERSEQRIKTLSSLYSKTFGDQKWYTEKIPLISSLLLAAGFSPLLVKSAYTINKAGYAALKKIIGDKRFTKLDKFFSGQNKALSRFKRRVSVHGIKIFTNRGKTTSLAPVVYLGEYLIGTITFLELHHVIDANLSKYWARYKGRSNLKEALKQLERGLPDLLEESDDQETLIAKIKSLETEWDNYRLALSEKSFSTYARHINSLNKMEQSKDAIFQYYSWIARGLDRTEAEWIENEQDWHKSASDVFSFDSTIKEELTNEENATIQEMFCGRHLEDAIEFTIDYSGIPIPFASVTLSEYKKLKSHLGNDIQLKSYKLHPYKMIDFDGVCETDLKKLDGSAIKILNHSDDFKNLELQLPFLCPINLVDDSFNVKETKMKKFKCLNIQRKFRRYLLESVFDKKQILTKVYEDFSEEIPDLLSLFKEQKIRRYENALQDEIKNALGIDQGDHDFSPEMKDTILASYHNEIFYWNRLIKQYSFLEKIITPTLELTKKELASAQALKKYISKNINERDSSELNDDNLFEEKTTWEGFWKGLIIQ